MHSSSFLLCAALQPFQFFIDTKQFSHAPGLGKAASGGNGIQTIVDFRQLADAALPHGAFQHLQLCLLYTSRPIFLKRALQQYRDYAFARLTEKSAFAFGRADTSAYLSALTNDTLSLETNYLSALFTLPANVLMLVGVLGLMLSYSPLLTAAALTVSLLPLGASLLAGGHLPVQEKRVSDANGAFLATLKDMLSGFPVIKSFQAEKEALRLFSESNAALQQVKCHAARTRTALQYIGGAAVRCV